MPKAKLPSHAFSGGESCGKLVAIVNGKNYACTFSRLFMKHFFNSRNQFGLIIGLTKENNPTLSFYAELES
jgi:hypothetical protein